MARLYTTDLYQEFCEMVLIVFDLTYLPIEIYPRKATLYGG
jgi:hypothetical protein